MKITALNEDTFELTCERCEKPNLVDFGLLFNLSNDELIECVSCKHQHWVRNIPPVFDKPKFLRK